MNCNRTCCDKFHRDYKDNCGLHYGPTGCIDESIVTHRKTLLGSLLYWGIIGGIIGGMTGGIITQLLIKSGVL